MEKFYLSLLLSFVCLASIPAQSQLEERLSLDLKDQSLEASLYHLVDQYAIRLSFSNDILPAKTISIQSDQLPLRQVLDLFFEGTNIRYTQLGKQIVLYQEEPKPEVRQFTISGYLEDTTTGERLIAASIYDQISKQGTITNEYGFFSLTLTEGEADLYFSYLGYSPLRFPVYLNENKKLNLSLNTSLTLKEVVVRASDSDQLDPDGAYGAEYIDIKDIDRLPNLGGETDVVRFMHLLPGVQTGTDGVGGVYIRGGNPGQNLVLIDGVPVYNISHAAGVFSVFNTSAIRSAKLIKGGFPARYGGRLSSVLDIHTKEGNKKKFAGRADIGLLTGRLSLEGPIIKDQSSFFLSGRWSLLDWYIRPITRGLKEDQGEKGFTGYRFYDLNAKFNHTFSDTDRIYFSFYKGSDRFVNQGERSDSISLLSSNNNPLLFRFDQSYKEKLQWGNTVAAFRWNHLFNDKLFSNITVTFSELAVDIDYLTADSLIDLQLSRLVDPPVFSFGRYQSGIEDVGVKIDFDFIPNNTHYLRFGLNVTGHSFRPGALTVNQSIDDVDQERALSNEPTQTREFAFYFEDEFRLSRRLAFNLGLHASSWSVQNRNYRSFQPRIIANYRVSDHWGLHASFSTMTQYLHLLSSSSVGILPTDLWVPSTSKVRPQESTQLVAGLDGRAFNGLFDLRVEGYFKKMNNLIEFTEGAFFLNDWEDNVTTGEGKAYGMEFFLRKRAGATTGWISYGLAWANRRFERINLGRTYPFKYDRRHDLKMVLVHRFAPWLEVSANWIFSSGFAYTIALEKFIISQPDGTPTEVEVEVPGEKNRFRMPYYHRLDLNANIYFQTNNLDHIISLGAYNVYSRKNPLYYDLRKRYVNENNQLVPKTEFVQVWLIPFLPSLSYSMKF